MHIRHEEYATLGDFIKASFIADQAEIMSRYPKLNEAFLTEFSTKLETVKNLTKRGVITQQQKTNTKSLYDEAEALDKELDYLTDYFEDANLDNKPVRELRNCLSTSNIEGATDKIETVIQLILANHPALVDEGMPSDFEETLTAHKLSLSQKNALQNQHMDKGKGISGNNLDAYEKLYALISKVANAGKKVFNGKIKEDEYTVTKILKRMRAAERSDDGNEDAE